MFFITIGNAKAAYLTFSDVVRIYDSFPRYDFPQEALISYTQQME